MRFWPILGFIIALNLGVAALMFMGTESSEHPVEKPLRASGALSTRNMAPAKGAPYNWPQMAFGGVIVVACAAGLFAFVRRQGRESRVIE